MALTPLTWNERGTTSTFTTEHNIDTNCSGRLSAILSDLSDPTGKTVWIGGADGGLWKTTDITTSPANWILIDDHLSNLAVTAICQDPTNLSTIYFCTGEWTGVVV